MLHHPAAKFAFYITAGLIFAPYYAQAIIACKRLNVAKQKRTVQLIVAAIKKINDGKPSRKPFQNAG
ncbi:MULTISPECIES: hypothetical protein [unclassified Pantoea]|uniref:hypothetical protein n=1 Tax=unclassified Pantoea TaxID=2630326 RepID=UPI0028A90EAF|nr:hypothetical protein [Pantoea sp.]